MSRYSPCNPDLYSLEWKVWTSCKCFWQEGRHDVYQSCLDGKALSETILKACFESVSLSVTTSFCTLNAHRHFLCVRSWGGHLELQLWAAHLRAAVRLGYNYSQGKLSKLQCKADLFWKTKQALERTNLCEFAWITLWLPAVVCVSWVHTATPKARLSKPEPCLPLDIGCSLPSKRTEEEQHKHTSGRVCVPTIVRASKRFD